MTYEEQRAVEQAADLAKPFSQLQEWHKDHKYRPLLLEPVIDRDKALKKAKLVKQILKSPLWPEMPYDVGDDKDLDPSAAPKPATHAGYLNGLVYRVQKNPEDKDALAVLLYAVYDDAALEIFRGKCYEGEGLTVNESLTPEDLAKVIADTQRLAALPQHNVTQQQLDELREQNLQLQDELDDYATDGETIWRRQAEGDAYWNNLVAIWKDKPGATAADIDAATRRPAWLPSVEVGYVLDLIDRVEKGHYDDIETGHCVDANDGLDAANELSKIFNIQPEDPITINQLVSKAWTWAMNAAPAAQEPTALHFHSLAAYKAWAAGASQQELEAYWKSLSNLDCTILCNDLEDEATALTEPETKEERLERLEAALTQHKAFVEHWERDANGRSDPDFIRVLNDMKDEHKAMEDQYKAMCNDGENC